jgi:hypothetical protein
MKYGRLAPHPEETHPRVWLHDHLTGPVPLPAVVDWASLVLTWPMLMNDRLGDCTCAGALHMFQAMTAYASTEFVPNDTQALHMYECVAGYNPVTGANDNGAVEQDVLQWLHDTGIAGHNIEAFAQVNIKNELLMKGALQTFGSLYVGINCPASMEQQFAAGEVIDYVPGSPIEGGHCVIIQRWDDEYLYIVTWGKLVKMTWRFWEEMGEEAWVVITKDFIEKNGMTPSGLNLTSLLAAFKALQAAPAPAPAAPRLPWFKRVAQWLQNVLRKL